MMLAGFYLPFTLHAQTCDPEADFSFSVTGCEAEFLPLYSGPGTVVHNWKFYNASTPVGSFSSSNAPLTIFTFLPVPGVTSKYVIHIVTITLPGGAVIVKTCSKSIPVTCTDIEGCYEKAYFYYQVSGCTVAITQGLSPVTPTWDFGDMTPPVTAALPSHAYAASGIYVVTATVDGQSCSFRIRVNCEESEGCCDAAFEARLDDDCGILRLVLDAKCNNGIHSWSILPDVTGACMSLEGFSSSLPDQTIQVTNINTYIVTELVIEHSMICNGQEFKETITIPLPTKGIYIGIDGQTTRLTDYTCVLPGSSITGPLTVYTSGVVRIDKPFTFHDMDIHFHKGETGFNIDITHAPLVLEECNLYTSCSCLWRGLKVSGQGSLICNSKTTISDALYGIRILTNSTFASVNLDDVSFNKNFIGIRRTGLPGTFAMQRTTFDGTGPLLDICELTQDVEAPWAYGYVGINTGAQPMLPVTFQTERGFAGMYMEQGPLNLNQLATASQNTFTSLAYGIVAYDCNTFIDENSNFYNLAGGAYGWRRTAGILFVDRTPQGPNTFKMANTLFYDCVMGTQVRAAQSAGPTMIGIDHNYMINVRAGIYLDTTYNNGELVGTGNVQPFIGVKHNTITATLVTGFNQVVNGGIAFADFSTGFSQVDISENNVYVGYATGGGGGIGAIGSMLSDPGPGGVEVDIHDNRVTLNGADGGLSLYTHPNGWIRNNSGGNTSAGNGVFILNVPSSTGIEAVEGGNNNLVSCNDVTVLSNAPKGLLYVKNVTNSQFLRNVLNGPGNGAHFLSSCVGTEFRCNDMINNTVGLLYDTTAVTGNQGTPTVTNGNKWIANLSGAFSGGGAVSDMSVIYALSEYRVRGAVDETPPSVVPTFGSTWFFAASFGATVDCLLDACPAPEPKDFALLSRTTPLDTLVAQGLMISADAPYAEEQTWQQEYYLWRKLKDQPELAQDNAMMQEFLAAFAGSNLEALWNIQVNMRHTIVPSADLLGLVQSNQQTIAQLEAQIAELVAQLVATTEPDQVALLEQQVVEQDSLLTLQIEAQEALVGAFEAQRSAAIAALLEQLAAIVPENMSETNLRSAYQIYLQTFASDVVASDELLAELEAIARQCPLEGGPGVYAAGALYQGFTGISPDRNPCNDVQRRAAQPSSSPANLSLHPNPNQGSFMVDIPAVLVGQPALLRILDARGSLIKSMVVNGEQTITLDLMGQPNGLYFVSLLGNGTKTEVLPFLIQH